MYEEHEFTLFVAQKAIVEKKKAKKNWEIKLLSDPDERRDKLIPDWYGYMRIDKL